MAVKDKLDLDQLADAYDVTGELGGNEDARTFLGARRENGQPVLISIAREPAGDEGNALSHLAADVNLLAGQRPRNIVPIIESRWIGKDTLAIVTERLTLPTLEEQLSRREEEFSYPRIATILQEVNAALEWARGQKVVHRGVRLDSVFVDPGSDRVYVSFVVKPLPPSGIPGEQSDARTIGWLARAMLTRSVADPERDKLSLAELRPGLPSRVVEQTDALIASNPGATDIPDVRGYIAAIAMSEELKRGETECLRVTTEMAEEQRITREALAAERKAHEEDLAEQARRFAKEREDFTRALAKEREDLTRALEKERAELLRAVAKEREEMANAIAKEREELASAAAAEQKDLQRATEKERKELQRLAQRERQALAKQREAMTKEREALAKERAAFERSSARGREQIAAKLAALQAQADLYAQTSELPSPDPDAHARFVEDFHAQDVDDTADEPYVETAAVAESDEFGDETNLVAAEADDDAASYDEIVDEPEELPPPVPSRLSVPTAFEAHRRAPWWDRAWTNRAWRRRGGVAAAALLLAVAAVAVSRRGGDDARANPPLAGARVTDSIARPAMALPVTVDSLAGSVDSIPTIEVPRPVRPVRRSLSTPTTMPERPSTQPSDTTLRTDTLFGALPFATRDTAASRDSLQNRVNPPLQRDSAIRGRQTPVPLPTLTPRGDTIRARPDSTIPDTLARSARGFAGAHP